MRRMTDALNDLSDVMLTQDTQHLSLTRTRRHHTHPLFILIFSSSAPPFKFIFSDHRQNHRVSAGTHQLLCRAQRSRCQLLHIFLLAFRECLLSNFQQCLFLTLFLFPSTVRPVDSYAWSRFGTLADRLMKLLRGSAFHFLLETEHTIFPAAPGQTKLLIERVFLVSFSFLQCTQLFCSTRSPGRDASW